MFRLAVGLMVTTVPAKVTWLASDALMTCTPAASAVVGRGPAPGSTDSLNCKVRLAAGSTRAPSAGVVLDRVGAVVSATAVVLLTWMLSRPIHSSFPWAFCVIRRSSTCSWLFSADGRSNETCTVDGDVAV